MKKWTKEEVTLLLECSKRITPMDKLLPEFPGRTVQALYHRLRRMKQSKARIKGRLPYRAADVSRLLEESGPMFAKEIAERLDIRLSSARQLMGEMHRQKKIHIKERVLVCRTNRAFLWAAGEGVDAPQLARNSKTVHVKPKVKKTEAVSIIHASNEMPRQPTQVIVRRDPFISALFGERAAA